MSRGNVEGRFYPVINGIAESYFFCFVKTMGWKLGHQTVLETNNQTKQLGQWVSIPIAQSCDTHMHIITEWNQAESPLPLFTL